MIREGSWGIFLSKPIQRNTYWNKFLQPWSITVSIHVPNGQFLSNAELVLVSWRPVLLAESSPWPPRRRAEWGFLLILPSPNRQTVLGKRGYQFLVWRQRLPSTHHFPSRIQYRPDQPSNTCWRPCLVHLHWRIFCSSFHVALAGWGWLEFAIGNFSENVALEKKARGKMAEKFLGNLFRFLDENFSS